MRLVKYSAVDNQRGLRRPVFRETTDKFVLRFRFTESLPNILYLRAKCIIKISRFVERNWFSPGKRNFSKSFKIFARKRLISISSFLSPLLSVDPFPGIGIEECLRLLLNFVVEFRVEAPPERGERVFRKFPLHMFGFVGKYNPILTMRPASVPSGVLLTLSNPLLCFSCCPPPFRVTVSNLRPASSELANAKFWTMDRYTVWDRFRVIFWSDWMKRTFSKIVFPSFLRFEFFSQLIWRFKRTFSVLLYKNWNNYNKYNLFIVLMYEVSKFGKLYTIFE